MAETLQGTTSNFKVLLLVAELSEFLNLIKKSTDSETSVLEQTEYSQRTSKYSRTSIN
jgi:hypothetical protein